MSDGSGPGGPRPRTLLPAEPVPVAIVGAGITGLALGRELARRGVESFTLEADERPGGIIHSPRARGRVLEMGPQRSRMVRPLERLVRDLGLEERLLVAPVDLPLFVYVEGKLRRVPTGPVEVLTTDLLTPGAKLRLLLEPFTGPAREGETVAEFVSRKLGRQAYERLVGPLYGGIYGSDPREMPMEHTLGAALETVGFAGRSLVLTAGRWMLSGRETPPAVSFVDGMQELTDALYRERKERIRLGTPALALEAEAGSWRVAIPDGELLARRVVLTCPADRAAEILETASPEAAERLARIRYNPLAIVHLRSDREIEGMGYQIAPREGFGTRGVTFNDSLFGRDGVYTAYLGGASARTLPSRPDEEVARVAREEFRTVTGAEAEVLRVGRTRMAAWDRSRAELEGLELPGGISLCAAYEARAGIPGRLEEARAVAEELGAATAAEAAPA